MNDKDFTYDDLREVLRRNGHGLYEGAMLVPTQPPRIWVEGIQYSNNNWYVEEFNKFLASMNCELQNERDNGSRTKYAGYIAKK
jgi:hypothetical protein